MPQVILKSKVSTVYLDKESEQLNKRIKKKEIFRLTTR